MFSEFFDFLKTPQIVSVLKFLLPVWLVIKSWWWLPLPLILWRPLCFLWLWWRTDSWLNKFKFILLEVRIPKEVLKPIRAMEVVMAGLRQVLYDPPDWWEKWLEGKINLSYSFEIASLGGEPHFYIRIPDNARDSVESIVYAQYPEAEIFVVDDYTKYVPKDIPNKDWELWAADYRLLKPDPYPIKTYTQFETEREVLEEKRVDPLASLLEAMAKVKPGEQLWVQMVAQPITQEEVPWLAEGEKIRDELARRAVKSPPSTPIILDAANVLISGTPPATAEEKKEIMPPEMKLTPGEREIIMGVEAKMAKPGYKTNIRFIFLGKKDVFFKPNLRLVFGFYASFITQNLNGLVPWGKTLTKIHKSWFLPLNLIFNRRLYLRKRSIFKKYVRRVNPFFPRRGGTFVLNIEEMATLFHFPGRGAAPAPFIPRIEAKKGEAPPGLPTGE